MLYHSAANAVGLYFRSMYSGPEQLSYFWMQAGVTLVAAIVVVLMTGPTLQRQARRSVEAAPVD